MKKNKKLLLTLALVVLTFVFACILNACNSKSTIPYENSTSISNVSSNVETTTLSPILLYSQESKA